MAPWWCHREVYHCFLGRNWVFCSHLFSKKSGIDALFFLWRVIPCIPVAGTILQGTWSTWWKDWVDKMAFHGFPTHQPTGSKNQTKQTPTDSATCNWPHIDIMIQLRVMVKTCTSSTIWGDDPAIGYVNQLHRRYGKWVYINPQHGQPSRRSKSLPNRWPSNDSRSIDHSYALNKTLYWSVVYLPLWKMMEFVSWDYDIPNILWNHPLKSIKIH